MQKKMEEGNSLWQPPNGKAEIIRTHNKIVIISYKKTKVNSK